MERRRWPRVDLETHVVMRFVRAEDVLEARSLNVSRHGIFLRTARTKPIGTRVHLSLALEETGERIEAEGFVVHVSPDPDRPDPKAEPGLGIFLTDVPPGWHRLCDRIEGVRPAEPATDPTKTDPNT